MPHRLNEISAGGRTIRWRETDPAATRSARARPLVLLHAFPLSAAMWEPQFDAFDGWRVIAPEMRGFRGPDGPAAEPAGNPTMPEFAMDVEHVLDALGVPEAVIGGCSMGGYVAFALLARAQARFRGLLLANTRATADSEPAKTARRDMMALADRGGAAAIADDMLPKLLGATTQREQPDAARRVRRLVEANTPEAIKAAVAAMMTRPDSRPQLASISCPALIIAGEEDTLIPAADADDLRQRIRDAVLVAIPRAGHLPNLEQPAAFNQALGRFLSAHFS